MKRYISLCLLWVCFMTLWGQTNGGYGGAYNPENPANPAEPSVTMKFDFKVTATRGGSVSYYPSGESKFVAGTSISIDAYPSSGYKFVNWLQDGKVISTSQWYGFTMPAKDVELKAVFVYDPDVPANPDVVPLTYKVTAEASPSRGGSVDYSREEVHVGSYGYVSASPYSGYKFKGWMYDGRIVSMDTYYNFVMTSKDMHFKALFEYDPTAPGNPSNNPDGETTYTVKYVADGVTYYTSQLPAGATLTDVSTPTKTGYTFNGWEDVPATMPASNLTINGSFTVNKYTVSYVIDGVVAYSEPIDYGAAVVAPAIGEKEGHTLTWENLPKKMPAQDVIVTGKYTVNKYKVVYLLDEVVHKTLEVSYGSVLSPEAEPTKEGHTFSGWSEIPATMPAKDVTVTGAFTANSYKVTYILDGETFKTEQVVYGTTVPTPEVPAKPGYNFSGWGEVPATMPAKDLTFTGSYTINKDLKYNLVYMVDGTEYKRVTIAFGDPIVLDAALTKEGHTFSGWSEVPETMPLHDVTVTASFTANSYQLTYVLDGVTFKTETVVYGTAVNAPEVPAKEGYTFNGWTGVPATMPAKDVTVTGGYTINKYTLTYTVDGTVYKSSELEYGATITAESVPTKEGHTFSGWSEIPATMPAGNVTVTGSFTANSYMVTYILDGATFKTEQVVYGTTVPTPEVPAKPGYNFSGWGEVPATMPAQDLTFSGSYTINKDLKYNLVYMVDGAEYKRVTIAFGDPIVLDAALTKEGHTFSGWSEVPETMPLHDVTVTASFTANSYQLTYVLDGVTFKTETVVYGTAITAPEAPTKEGYTFNGWTGVPATMPAQNVTVEGTFTINRYTLLYMVDGAEYKTVELEYGANIIAEAVPTKEGHTFSGWSEIPTTMPASNVTVTGTFTANSYKVTYILDGETFKTEQVVYGTAIPTPEVPAKPGYNFSGWGEVPATMPAQDLTFSGSYTINKDLKYNLVYMVDGVEYKRVTIAFGDPIVLDAALTKEGHTFSGWSEVPETMPLHDVTVTGSFTANSYQLTYVLDGVTFKTETVIYGTAITAPEAPAKEGYTFGGWTGVPATMPAKDVTVTGGYTINKYTLTYTVDGVVYKTSELEYGATITAEAVPTKEGHTFSGWSEIPATMPASNVAVTGSFTANSYMVTYILDGETFKTEQVVYGTTVPTPEVPAKPGYNFSGWGEVPATMPAKDLTFTGNYTINKDNKFNVIYMVDGTEYKRVVVSFGDPIEVLAAPVKEGHTFSGWSEVPETMPLHDVTVTGSFTANSYTLTYVLDGTTFKTETVIFGTAITAPEAPAKEGYTFNGWTGVPATMPAKDVTVTGGYTINKYTLTYTVDGTVYKTSELEYGASITAEAVPTKEGHTFSGWSEIPATMPAKDVTVTGSFTANSYKVTYILDGETFKTETVTYGTVIPTPEVPAKEGYNFSGWGEVPATMPAKDLTFTGSYTINKDNKFNVVYMVDGAEYKRVVVSFGDPIEVLAAPVKEGHTFSGWSEVPETMPLHDVTVTGSFTANSYTLTYVLDGVTFKTETVVYGTAITAPEAPAKEGHTFSGWSEIPATMPAQDVTVEGSFTINRYTLLYMVDGEEYKEVELEYGASIIAEVVPTKEGHTFSGWSGVPATMPAEDVTVAGTFTVNSYTITYKVDGEVYATEEVAYGEVIVLKEAPVKEGYIFSGWSEVPETMPAEDLEVTGSFASSIKAVITKTHVDVYSLQGILLKRQIRVEELKNELPQGIYIVDGKKVLVK